MKSLRTSFGRLLKAEKGKSGEGASNTLSSRNKWLLNSLQFLKVHIKPRSSLSNFGTEELQDDTYSVSETEYEVQVNPETFEMVEKEQEQEEMQELQEKQEQEEKQEWEEKQEMPKLPKKKRRNPEVEEISVLKAISSTLASVATRPQRDDIAVFLEHIGCKMRLIKSRKRQLLLQNEIQQVVMNAVLEETDE